MSVIIKDSILGIAQPELEVPELVEMAMVHMHKLLWVYEDMQQVDQITQVVEVEEVRRVVLEVLQMLVMAQGDLFQLDGDFNNGTLR